MNKAEDLKIRMTKYEDVVLSVCCDETGNKYPFGPFEWCQRIGIYPVFELLKAVYDNTKDERYKICPLY